MANPEVALDVQHTEEEKSQRSVTDEGDTRTTGGNSDSIHPPGWFSFNKIFNLKGKFLPMWNNMFVASCVFAVSFDPLFFYTPVINEKKKCVYFDTRLKVIALVLRLLTDHFYIADIIMRILISILKTKSSKASGVTTQAEAPNSKGKNVFAIAKRAWEKANRSYILIDILAILPIPQVGMFVFFSKMKGPVCSKERRLFDILILLQFVPRVLPVYLLCRERKKTLNKASMWTKGVFNFFLYILASHVLGALWYFFAIQREMDCWHFVCQRHKGCQPGAFSCREPRNRLRTIPSLDKECPINLSEEMKGKPFNFGIFADALDYGLVQSTDFPQKFLNCFWWGLRNLSSLGQNLHTSTYAWENLFAVFISIIGLLLFIYLIGNLQTYLQFATTRSEKIRRKMKTKNLEVDLWLSRKGLPSNLKIVIMQFIQQKLEQNNDVQVENILSVLPSAHSKYILRYLRLATLKKVPMLQTMGVRLLKAICEHLEPVDYPEDSCIIQEGEPLHKMIFITHGTVHTYKTNGKGGKIGSEFLEKGDFYGSEELLNWASKFSSYKDLPISTRMVKPVTKVEAFALSTDDLKSIAIKYWWNFTKKKDLGDFDQSLLEEYAVSSIEKEIRRRRQGKKKHTIRSLNKLATDQGSASQKLQKVISKVMRDQLPSPVGALGGR
ncbi:putative potassium channel, voltage-dependent, EAG/ELK/ERG [Rosa chinensis]|uniref:Putative potassium channel, voltage-dependent, EAG/ELK/ERG n=1 Tax=Rosa chinensis TaxID=74649 RepID=A0A2P6SP57_ROSCH|nr:cyclic nucleotide-gated ion channel 1 [Rosa chinensis]PRQ60443.1 putative potassium channel, voltage-dependent, EAG/ELK/ERG [Rosa chinensis]